MTFTTRQLVEKSIEQNNPLCLGFLKISKVFDFKVNREMLFKILESVKCPPTILAILKSMYSGISAIVMVENSKAPEFEVQTGVRKWCVLAQLLFFLYMHVIVKKVTFSKDVGVKIIYRTDSNMFSRKALQSTTRVNSKNPKRPDVCWRLRPRGGISWPSARTTLLIRQCCKGILCYQVNKAEKDIFIEDTKLENVTSLKYLGTVNSRNGDVGDEIDSSMSGASRTFESLYSRVWKTHDLETRN